jgi:cobalt transporter subunit CbtB
MKTARVCAPIGDRTMQQTIIPTTQNQSAIAVNQSAAAQIVGALILGAAMLFVVGFMDVAHNAAHDTRHAIAFPCH